MLSRDTSRLQEEMQTSTVTLWLFSLLPLICLGTASIDCFKCVSVDGNYPACEDPFHNNHSLALLESPCMGGRKGRDGVFPATACIKMAGKYADTGESITVRGCALDSGTLTTDTEIIRMSHCGSFYYEGRYVHGCVQSCDDSDGCNAAATLHVHGLLLPYLLGAFCKALYR